MKELLNRIIFEDFISYLEKQQDKFLYLPTYIEFMQTLNNFKQEDGSIKQNIHAKNSIKWLQKFVNGYMQEKSFKVLNAHLSFIGDDHDGLERNGHGNDIPDFSFIYDSVEYTLDTKIYMTKKGFEDVGPNSSSYHKADVICAACMDEGKYYWRVRVGAAYSRVETWEELGDVWQSRLGELVLPSILRMLRINVSSDATDSQLPETASYEFYEVEMNK